ncbi:flagellar type III secretion system pore protein FliP [Aliiruegeria sabulilitoris]|uniref:flagellar type III secretion system pore protein FliP n=1 Tax=Aliiruegeria sabulilitoris TaxID=1510458 RepID=UPI000831CC67|nr:flagellar type III secretion system pore protein FliP [Aliiruegeria sabulilitoris]NDR58374.1 flagellar type III secretion system pore protein FliP [Pseudoruegeria sp. M32A2M]
MRSHVPQSFLALPVLMLGTAGAHAQDLSLSLGNDVSLTGLSVQLFLIVALLGFAPGLLIMATCFPFIITVFSILRQAIGLQQSPPNMLIISVALVLTYYIMDPVLMEAWHNGLQPLMNEQLSAETAFPRIVEPFQVFMMARVDPETLASMADLRANASGIELDPASPPLSVLVPAFLLSEMSNAFQVGFLIFLPFLIIDLVVAAILMSMGMMMVPPALVSLPFKLAFFAIANGWTLISESLVAGYF